MATKKRTTKKRCTHRKRGGFLPVIGNPFDLPKKAEYAVKKKVADTVSKKIHDKIMNFKIL